MISESKIVEFVDFARKVGTAGLTICSSGNLSLRYDDIVLLSGTGTWLPELTVDGVSIVRFSDGEVLNGVRPSMESVFHLGVLRSRSPEINCVLHFQSPYATAIACMKNRPATMNFTAECPLHVGEEIPAIPYFRPGSKELADHVVEAMKQHNSVLLLKHGQVVCGKDFHQAFERAMFFEMACRIAILNGNNSDPLSSAEIKDLNAYFLGKKQ